MTLDFLRRADWLDAGRMRGYLRLFALLNLGALAWLAATSRHGVDRNHFLLGTDFLSFWTTGHMLRAGADVYDTAAHIAAQRAYFAVPGSYTAFFYPPPFLPYCYPLGFLGYFPALGLWLTATGALFAVAVRNACRALAPGQFSWTAFAAFPPVLITVTHGQTSFLLAALLGLGAVLLPARPWLAGAVFGLAVFKPQFGLAVPLVLLCAGQWRAILSALAVAAMLSLTATAAFGPGIWPAWLAGMGPARLTMELGTVGFAKMQSVFAGAMLLGARPGFAYGVQAATSLGVLALLALAAWRRGHTPALAAALLTGTLLATPFVLDYDLLLLAFPLVFLAGQALRPWEKSVAALAFAAPAFSRALALTTGIQAMPLVLIALFALLIRRALDAPGTDPQSSNFAGAALTTSKPPART